MKKIVTRILAVAIAFTTMVSMSGIMTVNAEAAAKNVSVKYTGTKKQAPKVKSISATIDGEAVKNKKATVYLAGTKKVKVDTTVTVKVNGKKKNKNFAKNVDKITYDSSNKKVATVNKNGVITAKKKGTTIITIKSKASNKVALKIKLTVKNGVKDMKLKSAKKVTLNVGDTHEFTPVVTTYKKVAKTIEASTSNKKVATVKVSKKGKVTITAKAAGTADITVSPKNGSDLAQVIKVTVKEVVKEYKTKVIFTDKTAKAVKLTGTIAWDEQSGISDAVKEFAAVLGGTYKVTVNGRTVEIKDGKVAAEDLAKIPESGSKKNAEVSATISIADALSMVEKADKTKTASFKGTFTLSGVKISGVNFASNVLTFKLADMEVKAFVEDGDLYLDGDQSNLLEIYKVMYDDNKSVIKDFEVVEK